MAARQPLKPVMLLRPPLAVFDYPGFWDELKEAGITDVAAPSPPASNQRVPVTEPIEDEPTLPAAS